MKTIRKIEPRFSNYNEIHEKKGRPDRAKKEIFIHENSVAMTKLPLEKLNQNWLKRHLPSLKRDSRSKNLSLAVQSFIKNDTSSLKCLEK